MHHDKQPDYLLEFAKQNRNSLSLPERLLWKRLKRPANKVFSINRQYPVLGKYILDFFYEDLQLGIEIDSVTWHEGRWNEDDVRQEAVEATGITFLRLSAKAILQDPDAVASFVLMVCSGEIPLSELDPRHL